MVTLFTIAIVSYTIGYALDNDAQVTISDEPLISDLGSNLTTRLGTSGWTENVNESSEAFYLSTIQSGDEVMEGGAQFKGGLSELVSSISSIFSLVKTKLFGGSNALGIFITTLSAFLVYIGIRYMYKTWVGRNPD